MASPSGAALSASCSGAAPRSISSITFSSYSEEAVPRMQSTTASISLSSMKQPCTRTGFCTPSGENSISPRPSSFSAPPMSRMVRESTCEDTANAIRLGMFALMMPVITSTLGRCVAITRCIPAARAICARRQMESSTSFGAAIMRSASSSMMMTIRGMCSMRAPDSAT